MGNLLVLAAGRRRYVIEELLRTKGDVDQLWVADSDSLTPGMTVLGTCAYTEPRASITEWLPEFCRKENINAVLSLHDYQAIAVSAFREELASSGALWIGPSYEVATTLLDKRALARFLQRKSPELSIPTFLPKEELSVDELRWVVKDRMGSGSSGLRTNLSRNEAQNALTDGDHVAQPMIAGEEWNVDFFVQPEGRIEGVSAKRKLRMRAGETDAAEVLVGARVPAAIETVIDAFRGLDHLGNVDVDVFLTNDQVKVVDVNPRFGGGYAFSLHAGYPAAEAVWALVNRMQWAGRVAASRSFRGSKSIEVVSL